MVVPTTFPALFGDIYLITVYYCLVESVHVAIVSNNNTRFICENLEN